MPKGKKGQGPLLGCLATNSVGFVDNRPNRRLEPHVLTTRTPTKTASSKRILAQYPPVLSQSPAATRARVMQYTTHTPETALPGAWVGPWALDRAGSGPGAAPWGVGREPGQEAEVDHDLGVYAAGDARSPRSRRRSASSCPPQRPGDVPAPRPHHPPAQSQPLRPWQPAMSSLPSMT